MTLPKPPEFRFWQKVDLDFDTGCWNWTAAKNSDGYGQFWPTNGKHRHSQAHRFSYETFIGKIPEGLTIDHICKNRGCVNPKHLEPVTIQVNVLRGNGMAVRNSNKTHCPQGHPYSGENLYIVPCNGGRQCKTCQTQYKKDRRGKKSAEN